MRHLCLNICFKNISLHSCSKPYAQHYDVLSSSRIQTAYWSNWLIICSTCNWSIVRRWHSTVLIEPNSSRDVNSFLSFCCCCGAVHLLYTATSSCIFTTSTCLRPPPVTAEAAETKRFSRKTEKMQWRTVGLMSDFEICSLTIDRGSNFGLKCHSRHTDGEGTYRRYYRRLTPATPPRSIYAEELEVYRRQSARN